MSAKWYFNKLRPGDKTREPIQGEFFATDAIRNSIEALVREGNQNTLDAGLKKATEPVRVRLLLAIGDHALPAAKAQYYFSGAWPHYTAPKNGLREVPHQSERCPYLVFEDFGTTGLQGDVAQWHDIPGVQNSFFYFFRAEGLSGKSDEDRGRWGVGKYVFPRMSRVSSFFGLTVRVDDTRRLLMGQSVLKSHDVDGSHYSPDGSFGEQAENGLILPTENQSLIDQFCADFRLKRKGEPGLSLVVPWVWEDEEVTMPSLIEAVVRGYFQPILTGNLVVTIETPERSVAIDHESLVSAVESLSADTAQELLPLVKLAEWAASRKPTEMVRLKPANPDRPDWNDDLIPEEQLTLLTKALERGEKLAVRAPLTVREKGKPPRDSFFDFFFVRDGDEGGRPTFIREGIIISDVRAPRTRGIRSIVTIEDGPIATLLGDSENPAHTQWQRDSSNFKGKYVYGPSYLDFVTRIVSSLVRCLSEQEKEEDPTLLLDIFSLPSPEEETESKEKKDKKKPDKVVVPPIIVTEPRKKRFRIQRVAGGFSVLPGEDPLQPAARLDIKVAYDLRRGSPLAKYDTADFQLGKGDIRFEPPPAGLKIVNCTDNRLEVEVQDSDFKLTVSGFDVKRDLFVSVRPEEAINDTKA